MSTCRCEQCCPANPGPTYTLDHKMACLARAALSWPRDRRKRFLDSAVNGWAEAQRRLFLRHYFDERERAKRAASQGR